jgi:membrane glycosyltransferase
LLGHLIRMTDMTDPFEVLARSHVRWNAVGTQTHICVTIIQKKEFKKIGYESVDRISLVQCRVQWWASSQLLKNFDPLRSIVLLLFFVIFLLVSASFRC